MDTTAVPEKTKKPTKQQVTALRAIANLDGRWIAARLVPQRSGAWKDHDPALHPDRWRLVLADGITLKIHQGVFANLLDAELVSLTPYCTGKFGEPIVWYTLQITEVGRAVLAKAAS